MKADELRALAERVQALTGPDREVDAWVAARCRVALPAGCDWAFRFPNWEGEKGGHVRLIGNVNGNGDYIAGRFKAPAFTASLDAAMTLCPDDHGEGPWLPCIESDSTWNGVRWRAQLGHYCYDATESCYAATPALALTAAALLARATLLQP
jgi:hypothetical protein